MESYRAKHSQGTSEEDDQGKELPHWISGFISELSWLRQHVVLRSSGIDRLTTVIYQRVQKQNHASWDWYMMDVTHSTNGERGLWYPNWSRLNQIPSS